MNSTIRAFYNRFYGPFKWDIVRMTSFFLVQNIYAWSSPIFVGLLIDLVASDDQQTFWLIVYSCILLGMIVINMPAALMRVRYQSKITRAASHSLRFAIFNQVQRLTLLRYDSRTDSAPGHLYGNGNRREYSGCACGDSLARADYAHFFCGPGSNLSFCTPLFWPPTAGKHS